MSPRGRHDHHVPATDHAHGTGPTRQALTALTPIIPGRRAQLQQVLAMVRDRIAAGGPTTLDEIGTVHFARWVVLPDDYWAYSTATLRR